MDPVCAQRRGPNPIVCEMVSKYGCCGKECLQHGCLAERGCMATETIATPGKVRPELRESHLENIKRMFEITGAPCKHVGACSLTLSSSYFLLTFLLLFWLISQLPPPFFSHSLPSFWGALSPPNLCPSPSLPACLAHKPLIHPSMSPCLPRLHLSVHLSRRLSSPVFHFYLHWLKSAGSFSVFSSPSVSRSLILFNNLAATCLVFEKLSWPDLTRLCFSVLLPACLTLLFPSQLSVLLYLFFPVINFSSLHHLRGVSFSLSPLSLFLSSSILVSPPFIRLSHSDIWFIFAPFLFFSQLCLSLSLP